MFKKSMFPNSPLRINVKISPKFKRKQKRHRKRGEGGEGRKGDRRGETEHKVDEEEPRKRRRQGKIR